MVKKEKLLKLIPIISSVLIIVLVAVSIIIGFTRIQVPAESVYRALDFNFFFEFEEGREIHTFSDDSCSSILTFIGAGLAISASIINIIFCLIKKNKITITLILDIITILGVASIIVHFSLISSNFYIRLSRATVDEEMIPIYGIIISSLAALFTLINLVSSILFRRVLFVTSSEDANKAVLGKLAAAGVLIVAIGAVFGGGAISFSKTKTKSWKETADWGDIIGGYQGNVGDKIEHVTKTSVSSCAYENIPCILLMVAFAIMVIVFFIIAVKKDDDEYMKTLIISSVVLGVISNIVEFFMCGGTAWLFGIGTFMVLGSVIALGAFKILENSKPYTDLKNIN